MIEWDLIGYGQLFWLVIVWWLLFAALFIQSKCTIELALICTHTPCTVCTKMGDLQNDPHGYLGRFCPSQKSQKHSYVQNWVNTSPLCTRYPLHCSLMHNEVYLYLLPCGSGERGTLGMFGWGCAAGTLESIIYTRASSAEFWSPILE